MESLRSEKEEEMNHRDYSQWMAYKWCCLKVVCSLRGWEGSKQNSKDLVLGQDFEMWGEWGNFQLTLLCVRA